MRTKSHEKNHPAQNIPNLVFYQFISKPFVSHNTYVIYSCGNILEKTSITSNFWSAFAVTIEVKKYNEAKKFSGICCTIVLSKFHIFVTSFAQFATSIKEVCLESL